jgi:ATP-dependent protease ClpP protease subunit
MPSVTFKDQKERAEKLAGYHLSELRPKMLMGSTELHYAMTKEGEETVINVSGIVGDFFEGLDAATLVTKIQETEGDITVRLNTPGGMAFEAFDIFDALAVHPGHVRADIVAKAWSAGAVIAMAADEVRIRPHAPFGIHRAIAGFLLVGNAEGVRSQLKQLNANLESLDKLDIEMAKLFAERSGNTVKQSMEWLEGEEGVDGTEFVGQEAIDAGFADSLIENKKKGGDPENFNLDAMRVQARQRSIEIAREMLTTSAQD